MSRLGKVTRKMVFSNGGAVGKGNMITIILFMRTSHCGRWSVSRCRTKSVGGNKDWRTQRGPDVSGYKTAAKCKDDMATVVNELTFDGFWIDLSLVRMFELMGGMLVRIGDEGC